MKKPLRGTILLLISTLFVAASFAQQPEYGQASFYDDSFQGSETAYGVKYDKNKLTCAHKIHPYGTVLRVTRLDNKRSVDVTVIDKGPYLKGRVVDLSRRAAERLGMLDDGVVDVKVELIKRAGTSVALKDDQPKEEPEPISRADRPSSYDDPLRTTTPPPASETSNSAQNRTNSTVATPAKTEETSKGSSTTPAKQQAAPQARLVGKDYAAYDLYQIQLMRPAKKGFGVQVASLVTYEYVLRQVADLQAKSFDEILVSVEKGEGNAPIYKIILGNFENEASANNYKKDLKRRYKIDGFVVDLSAVQY